MTAHDRVYVYTERVCVGSLKKHRVRQITYVSTVAGDAYSYWRYFNRSIFIIYKRLVVVDRNTLEYSNYYKHYMGVTTYKNIAKKVLVTVV